ncbi:hypothetical protein TRIATDRAFT_300747 [Trichoderma atroviride IMI 206040]|uniref:Uncharacterized protein n=1 Tax=Hypocrea atroviridis (strain ATCC 20476 / IMI 206040) TaxID=452589 RepID=G9P1S0_HYPAI|nr:uncharacterized protein TRIATDRAFT_300747 [Trichoderma atroviride IMI 206040]EHK42569.1 hypothetical protein TRIATDRAFT_300747 [Trichoderma atroviride IMI 206040]
MPIGRYPTSSALEDEAGSGHEDSGESDQPQDGVTRLSPRLPVSSVRSLSVFAILSWGSRRNMWIIPTCGNVIWMSFASSCTIHSVHTMSPGSLHVV